MYIMTPDPISRAYIINPSIPLSLLGNDSVETLQRQRVHTQQCKTCWTRRFLYDPCLITGKWANSSSQVLCFWFCCFLQQICDARPKYAVLAALTRVSSVLFVLEDIKTCLKGGGRCPFIFCACTVQYFYCNPFKVVWLCWYTVVNSKTVINLSLLIAIKLLVLSLPPLSWLLSVVLVRKRTISIERSPPVSEASANFSG
jgi:hypothetical protein